MRGEHEVQGRGEGGGREGRQARVGGEVSRVERVKAESRTKVEAIQLRSRTIDRVDWTTAGAGARLAMRRGTSESAQSQGPAGWDGVRVDLVGKRTVESP